MRPSPVLFALPRQRFEDAAERQLGEEETHAALVWLRERALDRPHRATEPLHLSLTETFAAVLANP